MAKLTRTEELFVRSWPTPLKRKIGGCDFVDEDGTLIEVKSKTFSRKQLREMTEAVDSDRQVILAHVSQNAILIFHLHDIIRNTAEVSQKMNEYRDLEEELVGLKNEVEQLKHHNTRTKKNWIEIEQEGTMRCAEIRKKLIKLRDRQARAEGKEVEFLRTGGNHFIDSVSGLRCRKIFTPHNMKPQLESIFGKILDKEWVDPRPPEQQFTITYPDEEEQV